MVVCEPEPELDLDRVELGVDETRIDRANGSES